MAHLEDITTEVYDDLERKQNISQKLADVASKLDDVRRQLRFDFVDTVNDPNRSCSFHTLARHIRRGLAVEKALQNVTQALAEPRSER